MAARRICHWAVEYYSTAEEPRACVVLGGYERHGLIRRHTIPVVERVPLPTGWTLPKDYRSNQKAVRRAMRLSRHRWRGRIP